MNVVDSSGWLEYFADDPNADFFAPAIENTDELIVPSIAIYEVFKRVLAQRGEDAALQVAAQMQQGRVDELTAGIAVSAVRLSAALKLPMADSVILATARQHGTTLWTQDADFKAIEDVRYVEKAQRGS